MPECALLGSYAGRVAAGKPEYEEDSVFCSSLLSNFRVRTSPA